jgi:hypothetical protein
MGTSAAHLRKHGRTLSVLAVIALLALVVAGCSSSGSSSKSSGTSNSTTSDSTASGGSNTTLPTCPSEKEVDAVLKAGLSDPTSVVNGSIRTCTYKGPPGGDDVVITYETGVSATTFQAAQESPGPNGETATAVTGIGDAAYSTTSGAPGNEDHTLAVLQGTTAISIRAPVEVSQIEDLARKLLADLN